MNKGLYSNAEIYNRIKPCSFLLKQLACSLKQTFLVHLRRRLIDELIVYAGIHRPSVVRRLSTFSSEAEKPFFSNFTIYRFGGTNNCVFGSGRIRTLGYFDFILQKCLLSSPLRFIRLLSKSLNLIGCPGGKKG